jgi:hypothetical protein
MNRISSPTSFHIFNQIGFVFNWTFRTLVIDVLNFPISGLNRKTEEFGLAGSNALSRPVPPSPAPPPWMPPLLPEKLETFQYTYSHSRYRGRWYRPPPAGGTGHPQPVVSASSPPPGHHMCISCSPAVVPGQPSRYYRGDFLCAAASLSQAATPAVVLPLDGRYYRPNPEPAPMGRFLAPR